MLAPLLSGLGIERSLNRRDLPRTRWSFSSAGNDSRTVDNQAGSLPLMLFFFSSRGSARRPSSVAASPHLRLANGTLIMADAHSAVRDAPPPSILTNLRRMRLGGLLSGIPRLTQRLSDHPLPRPTLPVWQGVVTALVVVCIGTVVSAVDVAEKLHDEGALITARIDEAIRGIHGPAVQAAALTDDRLAESIADSVRSNPAVSSIRIFALPNGEPTLIASAGSPALPHLGLDASLLRYAQVPAEREVTLTHDGTTVGTLLITVNPDHFLQRIYARLQDETIRLFGTSIVLGLLLYLVTMWTVTRPIQRLVAALDSVDPEHPGDVHVPARRGQRHEVHYLTDKLGQVLHRLQAELDARHRAEHRLRISIEGTRQVAYEVNFQNNTRWMTPNFAELLGFPTGTDVSRYSLTDIIHPDDRQRITTEQSAYAASGRGMYEAEYRLLRPVDGGVVWVLTRGRVERGEDGSPIRFLGMTSDITARKRAELRLEEMAQIDLLTGLPNRAISLDRADQAVRAAVNRNTTCAIIHLDLHRFHDLNETFGHDAGDTCLRLVAQRLSEVVPDGTTVGRVNGDEFLVIAPELSAATADALAERLVAAGSAVVKTEALTIVPNLSAGVAMCPSDGRNSHELLAAAQIAVIHADRTGPGQVRFYDPGLGRTAAHRRTLEHDLQAAVKHGGLFLLYQPRFDAITGSLVGVEALLRWRRGADILHPPAFLSIAEDAGIANDLGIWVIERALADYSVFRGFLPWDQPFRIALNLSPDQVADPQLPALMQNALATHNVPANAIEFELTEASLLGGSSDLFRRLQELRDLGIKIALDDFGTGYTSLQLVSRMPITAMHFERSFLEGAMGNPVRSSIVQAVVGVAQGVGLPTLVKGIETEDMRQFCSDLKITEVQGYHFAVPMPLSGVRDWYLDPMRPAPRLASPVA